MCDIVEDLRFGIDDFTNYLRNNTNVTFDAYIDCTLHNNGFSTLGLQSWYRFEPLYTLMDFFKDRCEWGVLGSNKMSEEKLKLFPSKGGAQAVCDIVKDKIKRQTGKNVVVCIYGDGCFKSPSYMGVSVWEFADPATLVGFTDKELMETSPNELKLKTLIDNESDNNEINNTLNEKRGENLNNEKTMGTTPRLRKDLLASLMDLVSGSGDRATPCVLVKNYF